MILPDFKRQEYTMDLKATIRNVQDFPKPGIGFKDITTLLKDPVALKEATARFLSLIGDQKIDKVVGIESRGFVIGGILADKLHAGFIPVRKPKKLPAPVYKESYSLEYGTDSIEMHIDAIQPGDNVILHDDLLATGGTAEAAIKLIEKAGGNIVGILFIVELSFLNGRAKLGNHPVHALVEYDGE